MFSGMKFKSPEKTGINPDSVQHRHHSVGTENPTQDRNRGSPRSNWSVKITSGIHSRLVFIRSTPSSCSYFLLRRNPNLNNFLTWKLYSLQHLFLKKGNRQLTSGLERRVQRVSDCCNNTTAVVSGLHFILLYAGILCSTLGQINFLVCHET